MLEGWGLAYSLRADTHGPWRMPVVVLTDVGWMDEDVWQLVGHVGLVLFGTQEEADKAAIEARFDLGLEVRSFKVGNVR